MSSAGSIPRYFCHACQRPVHADLDTGAPICTSCGSDFVEEREGSDLFTAAQMFGFMPMGDEGDNGDDDDEHDHPPHFRMGADTAGLPPGLGMLLSGILGNIGQATARAQPDITQFTSFGPQASEDSSQGRTPHAGNENRQEHQDQTAEEGERPRQPSFRTGTYQTPFGTAAVFDFTVGGGNGGNAALNPFPFPLFMGSGQFGGDTSQSENNSTSGQEEHATRSGQFTFHFPQMNQQQREGGGTDMQNRMFEQMMQQVQALLGQMASGPVNLGDYVTSQQGLDAVIDQLMQQAAQQNRPAAASEEVINALPRKKFHKNDQGIQYQDCSVCQDNYKEEEIVIELPCHHVFHPECILSWLKLNGSCPVCRFSLVDNSGGESASSPRPSSHTSPA